MAATFLRRIALPNLFRLGFETLPEAGSPATHARWIAGHVLAHGLDNITASKIGRAYRELRGKLKDLELSLYYRRLSDLGTRLDSLANSGATLSTAEQEAEAALVAAETNATQRLRN